MSGQATGWVLRHGPRDRALRLVLVAIADAANRDGEHAHPGMDAIVDASLYSPGHVRRAIARLVDEGWLEVTEHAAPGRATEYAIPGVRAGDSPGEPAANAAHSARRSAPDVARTSRDPERDVARFSTPTSRDIARGVLISTTDIPTEVPTRDAAVRSVFDAWVQSTGGTSRTLLTPERERLIKARLAEGYSVDDLIDAVRGWTFSPHHRGENDRGTVYNDLKLLLRDGSNVERFRAMTRRGQPRVVPPVLAGIDSWLNQERQANGTGAGSGGARAVGSGVQPHGERAGDGGVARRAPGDRPGHR